MSGINTEYTIYLKVLTPLHIGGAQEKDLSDGLDYLKDGIDIWRVNWEKVYQEFSPDEVSKAMISREGLYDLLFEDKELYCNYWDIGYGDSGVIKSVIRDAMGKPFIPGSSLKGALKNWFYSSFDENPKGSRDLLGTFETDLFRFIKPSDCYMNEVRIFPTKTFNLSRDSSVWEGSWKHKRNGGNNPYFNVEGFVTDYECFPNGLQTKFQLRLNDSLNDEFEHELFDLEIRKLKNEIEKTYLEDKKKQLQFRLNQLKNGKEAYVKTFHSMSSSPLQILFEGINSEVQQHIEKEMNFFERYQSDGTEAILQQFQRIKQISKNIKNSCLLRLSAGSGFHGISGDFQFNDHTKTGIWNSGKNSGKMKYKSRKIAFTANEKYPMGFVLLSTKPFEGNENKVDAKQEVISPIINSLENKAQLKEIKAETKDAQSLKTGDIVFGAVLELGKPFCRVKLFLSNYNFSGETDLSGTKKHQIVVGQIVKCELGSRSPDGEFKQVKFIP
ncbi:MAG: hypothetical protein H3C64_11055 [Candidatus Kuenenia stuttgartiensis]|nr:hypothetical protein [Candidatus Kuenenia stuttgartiensis]